MKLSAEGGQAKPETIMLWVKPIVVYLAILPFYLLFTGLDLQILRLARMMRVLRAFKIWRYSASLHMLQRVIVVKKEQLVSALFILILLTIIAACLLVNFRTFHN